MDRPRGVDAYVAARTHAGKAAQQIADELNAAGVVTASGRPLSTQCGRHGGRRSAIASCVQIPPFRGLTTIRTRRYASISLCRNRGKSADFVLISGR